MDALYLPIIFQTYSSNTDREGAIRVATQLLIDSLRAAGFEQMGIPNPDAVFRFHVPGMKSPLADDKRSASQVMLDLAIRDAQRVNAQRVHQMQGVHHGFIGTNVFRCIACWLPLKHSIHTHFIQITRQQGENHHGQS